jgi:hypothetical protein
MAHTTTTTHPIRGALWGLVLGVGLALVLVITKVIYLDLVPILVVLAATVVVGILWGQFAPATPPKGPEPVRVEQIHARESTRFDDFTDSGGSSATPASVGDDTTTDGHATAGGDDATPSTDAVSPDGQSGHRPDPPPTP